jgi:hypothetical protein
MSLITVSLNPRSGSPCARDLKVYPLAFILVLTAFTSCRAMGPVRILSVDADATILTVSDIK